MTQMSYWWTTTSGSPTGHQVSNYTQSHLSKIGEILAACSGFEGVAPNYLNSLAGSVTGSNTVRIATGGAVVDGKVYHNSANVDVNIPSAVGGGNTRYDRIVLRADWAGYKVDIVRVAGVDAASPTLPGTNKTSGTTYDIELYQALVDTSGNVTIGDERVMASVLMYREGGSATNWATAGTNQYPVGNWKIHSGVREVTVTSGAGSIAIGFPTDFAYTPIVTCGLVVTAGQTSARLMIVLTSILSTGIQGYIRADDGASSWDGTVNFHWVAIGPMA